MADADSDSSDFEAEFMEYNDFTVFVHTTAVAENDWSILQKYTLFSRLERAGTVYTKPDSRNPYVWIQYPTYELAESRSIELAKLKLNGTPVTARLNDVGNTSGCQVATTLKPIAKREWSTQIPISWFEPLTDANADWLRDNYPSPITCQTLVTLVTLVYHYEGPS